jgi:hypothetical protein
LAVASVAHPDEIPPNAIMQANLRERNPSVSYRYNMFLADTDDQQAQQSRADFFPNAQNILIAGGSFTIVNLCCGCGCVCDCINSMDRTIFCLLILVECRKKSLLYLKGQTPVQFLLDG